MPLCLNCIGYNQPTGNVFSVKGDLFVLKLNKLGLLNKLDKSISTFFGGTGPEYAGGICLGENNSFYISGFANASSYATFPYQSKSGAYFQTIYQNFGTPSRLNITDGFIAQFDVNNNLVWSSAIGGYDNPNILGTTTDCISGLAFDSNYNLYATGSTTNIGLVEGRILNGTYATGFFPIVKTNLSQYSRINSGDYDAVILKFNANNALVWSSEFGGMEQDNNSNLLNSKLIAINSQDELFIAGATNSYMNGIIWPLFPLYPNNILNGYNQHLLNKKHGPSSFQDGFIAKFNSNNEIVWSTYIGGEFDEIIKGISCRNTNKLFIAGNTNSINFPIKFQNGNYVQQSISGASDGFVMALNNNNLNYFYSSYFGGDGDDQINSIDCRLNSTDEFVLSGQSNYTFSYLFANPPGNFDYFTIGSHPLLTNGFVSNIKYQEPWIQRNGDFKEENKLVNIIENNNGYQLVFTENTKVANYIIYDVLGKIVSNNEVKLENRIDVKFTELRIGINIISIYDNENNRINLKLFSHE